MMQVLEIVDTSSGSSGSGVLKWGEESSESSSGLLSWLEDPGSWMFCGVLSDSSTVLDMNPVSGKPWSSSSDSGLDIFSVESSGSDWFLIFRGC